QGRSLANIGRGQLSARRLKEAETFERAIPLSRAAGDKLGEAVTHATVAQTYLSMGEGRQALGHFEHAYQAAPEPNDVRLHRLPPAGVRGRPASPLAKRTWRSMLTAALALWPGTPMTLSRKLKSSPAWDGSINSPANCSRRWRAIKKFSPWLSRAATGRRNSKHASA